MGITYFETALERIGRIIARQYNIDVRFEGNLAYTDGKNIVLPQFENMTTELKQDLNGYLDHEVGHCRYTDFPQIKEVDNTMHRYMLNACEDVRIERAMIDDYPGCALNLYPMNERLEVKIAEKWDEFPAPIRIINGVRNFMENGEARYDDDTKAYLDLVKDRAIALNDVTDTKFMRIKTGEIVKLILEERERQKEEEKEEEEKEKGKGGEGEEGESKGSSGGSSMDWDDMDAGEKFDAMVKETMEGMSDEEKSLFEQFITDATSMINNAIADHFDMEESDRIPTLELCEEFNSAPHIPASTKFDKVIDNTGGGSATQYAELMNDVKRHVRPIQNALERVLKVRENARWTLERERGRVDARNLGKLLTDPNFRRPFREFTKEDISNVAVELLIDMSGSMGGQKIRLAKEAALAMGEALAGIGIAFEATGFHTDRSHELSRYSEGLSDTSRFNRIYEAPSYHVFKSFDNPRMYGICEVRAGGNNTDGEAVKWAGKRLAERSEKRKIMMVFSDGHPADHGNQGILNNDLKQAVKKLNKLGIETVGIGIMSNAVSRFYPDHIVINNLPEFPKIVMSKVARMLENTRVA